MLPRSVGGLGAWSGGRWQRRSSSRGQRVGRVMYLVGVGGAGQRLLSARRPCRGCGVLRCWLAGSGAAASWRLAGLALVDSSWVGSRHLVVLGGCRRIRRWAIAGRSPPTAIVLGRVSMQRVSDCWGFGLFFWVAWGCRRMGRVGSIVSGALGGLAEGGWLGSGGRRVG
jgi:hypothetical protein